MALRVAIFEDDKDLADLLKEIMDQKGYDVVTLYSLKKSDWPDLDIVLADFRNKLVAFQDIVKSMKEVGIPVIAMSGADTGFSPELIKPFSIDELESKILETISANGPRKKGIGSVLMRKFGL